MQETELLTAQLESLLAGAGIVLVELSLSRRHGSAQTRAVVYSATGTGIAECSKAHRLIYPRLQIMLGIEDPYLEVTSPGIDRVLRSNREWEIFRGREVRVFLKDDNEPTRGRIVSSDAERVVLAAPEGEITIARAEIAKARLDYPGEGD
jgi:ribosome maturation factor RimP